MGIFGGSYPPGCNGPPDDEGGSPESERVWELLEAAGVEESLIEQVCAIVDDLAHKAAMECPVCLDRHVNEMGDDPTYDEYLAQALASVPIRDEPTDSSEDWLDEVWPIDN